MHAHAYSIVPITYKISLVGDVNCLASSEQSTRTETIIGASGATFKTLSGARKTEEGKLGIISYVDKNTADLI